MASGLILQVTALRSSPPGKLKAECFPAFMTPTAATASLRRALNHADCLVPHPSFSVDCPVSITPSCHTGYHIQYILTFHFKYFLHQMSTHGLLYQKGLGSNSRSGIHMLNELGQFLDIFELHFPYLKMWITDPFLDPEINQNNVSKICSIVPWTQLVLKKY